MSRPEDAKALLFDLDGTLVDSAPDLATAVDRMLRGLGRAPVGEELVRGWIGNGARRLVMRALTRDYHGEPPEDALAPALERFYGEYRACLTDRTRPYPGVVAALERLTAAEVPLGVVTNKPERFALPLLEALGLDRFFGVVVGGDTLAVRKPDPAPLEHAAAALGVPARGCVLVGDSLADAEAAERAGSGFVAVGYGYGRADDNFYRRAVAVVQRLDELPGLVRTSRVESNDHGHQHA